MRKSDFIQMRSDEVAQKYASLKATKMRKPDILKVLSEDFELATSTINDILFRKSYQKPFKKLKTV